jgi:hypothetical protein
MFDPRIRQIAQKVCVFVKAVAGQLRSIEESGLTADIGHHNPALISPPATKREPVITGFM